MNNLLQDISKTEREIFDEKKKLDNKKEKMKNPITNYFIMRWA